LGFEIVLDIEIPDSLAQDVGLAPTGFRQVRLKAGNTLIKLMDIESPLPTPTDEFSAGVRWLTFIVADIQKTVENLKQNGVEFLSEPISAPDAAGVVCAKDPDGILIELVQI
jgi:catechol 2,3-dioxygenase-like lactoylglutathione lyase family enzyme